MRDYKNILKELRELRLKFNHRVYLFGSQAHMKYLQTIEQLEEEGHIAATIQIKEGGW